MGDLMSPKTRKPAMVFHAPYPLQEFPVAASALRPKKMKQAFEDAGFDVIEVTGFAKERRKKAKSLLRRLDRGLKVEFVYSESATIPNSFTEPRHFPLHLFLDRWLFKEISLRKIPLGVFYRDVYWVFPEYDRTVGRLIAAPMKALYKWDLDGYLRYVSKVFVPADPYWEYAREQLPHRGRCRKRVRGSTRTPDVMELPPAADFADMPVKQWNVNEVLEVLYVGGVDNHLYDPTILIRAIGLRRNVALTLCTPEESWKRYAANLEEDLPANVRVVHARGSQLDQYYARAHVCSLYLPPEEYRDFAVPLKMYEYLAHSRPVFATQGSLAASFIEEHDVGWSVTFGEIELNQFFDELEQPSNDIGQKGRAAQAFGRQNSWRQRALEAAAALDYDSEHGS